MKRYKKLLILLFSTNILFATTSPNELFSKKINETFNLSSAPIMTSTYDLSTGENHVTTQKRENYPLWLDVRTLDNVEHNNSQKILKEKMDELVGYYLKTNELFSKEALALSKKNGYKELRYDGFFKRLYLYLNYLEKHNNKKLLNTLLAKALNDSTMLMKNSDSFLNYMLSVNMLKKIYGSLNDLTRYRDIFLKYPFPSSELFFEKLELDKQEKLQVWTDTESQGFNEVSLINKTMQKIKDEVTQKFRATLDTIYEKAKGAILDGSKESMKAYEEYVLSIQKIDNPIWEQIKFKSSLYKVKVFEMLGIENNDFGNIPDVMVVFLAKFFVPYLDVYQEIYKEHQELEKMYRGLIGA